tara:strand:+ start:1231 stop:1470 length:240 start_codon:yes stop_codon:yes gene_type:complete
MYADNAGSVIGDLLYQHLPVADPTGSLRSCKNAYPRMECMQSNVWNIACPGIFVIYREVMYVGFAGAVTDHSVQVDHIV